MARTYKSTRKLTTGPKVFRGWKQWSEGDILIGTYMESYEDKKFHKQNHVFTVVEAMFKNKKEGADLEGKVLVLNGTGMLDKAIEKTAANEMLQITYQGLSEIESGPYAGTESHSFDIQTVEEDIEL